MKVLLVSYNRFPNSDAGALRDYIFSRMLRELGHKILVVGMGESTNFSKKNYMGIDYISLRNKSISVSSRVSNYFGYTNKLKKIINNYLPDIIWVVNIPIHSLIYVKNYAIINDIKLFHDSVEWYSRQQFILGVLSPEYVIKDITNRIIINKCFRVISISEYLHQYYSSKGINSLRIPVIFDKNEINYTKNVLSNKLVLVYAGTPGNKDYLHFMINALSYIPNELLRNIEFRLVGINEKDVLKMFEGDNNSYNKIYSSLKIYGRVPRERVLEIISEADFTVLLRNPYLRYSKAGFPTKFVESIALATPMILNISSDLNIYLEDMKNCILVRECSAVSFSEALLKAYEVKIIKGRMDEMYNNARNTFENYFDYRKYINKLSDFLE